MPRNEVRTRDEFQSCCAEQELLSRGLIALGEPVSECEPLQPTGGEVTDRAGEKRSPKSSSEWESLSTTGSSVSECPEVRLAPQKANATRVAQSAS